MWRGRQAESAWHAEACQARKGVLNGARLEDVPDSTLFIRSDALDQAKHRMPRVLVKPKSFELIIRPAAHCHMSWFHAYDVAFGICDADFHKDTCTHLDQLARGLSRIFDSLRALPRRVTLVLDNTSSNNKNQIMVRFLLKCKLLGIFDQVYLAFPVKGHTLSPLDSLGGHAVVRCCNSTVWRFSRKRLAK